MKKEDETNTNLPRRSRRFSPRHKRYGALRTSSFIKYSHVFERYGGVFHHASKAKFSIICFGSVENRSVNINKRSQLFTMYLCEKWIMKINEPKYFMFRRVVRMALGIAQIRAKRRDTRHQNFILEIYNFFKLFLCMITSSMKNQNTYSGLVCGGSKVQTKRKKFESLPFVAFDRLQESTLSLKMKTQHKRRFSNSSISTTSQKDNTLQHPHKRRVLNSKTFFNFWIRISNPLNKIYFWKYNFNKNWSHVSQMIRKENLQY